MKRPRDLGLFSWRQVRNETPFTFLAEIIVGCIFLACGIVLCKFSYDSWHEETRLIGLGLFGIGLALTGIFQAHAGVIFWFRRLFRKK